jgi:uncharacterized repeat protein (TIGR03803 family)
MRKLKAGRIIGIIIIVCAAATISAPAQTFTKLYNFCSQPNCTDGSYPDAGLVQGTDGSFYGTTLEGGSGYGTIFKINAGGHLTTLYTFCSQPNCADGGYPQAGLVQGSDGAFYGTTSNYGSNVNCFPGCGTIFRITPEGEISTLYTFCAERSEPDCPDGGTPYGSLIQATDGNFYGTTGIGGTGSAISCGAGCGTVFRMTPTGKLTVVHSFCSETNCADGELPDAGVIQGANGNLYGTTREGGNLTNEDLCFGLGCGTVFELTLSGDLTTLYSFCPEQEECPDGYFPEAPVVQGSDGTVYGTTLVGGNETNSGVAFGIDPSGAFEILHTFCSQPNCDDGGVFYSGLIQATDGNLYGVNAYGGNTNHGTAFQLTTSGTVTTLYSFCSQPSCTDGSGPDGGLLQATNGAFYGTTGTGGQSVEVCFSGVNGCGTIFSLSTGLRPFVETRPTSANAGSEILILGNNLTGATSVTFNGAAASFTVASDTLIQARVPAGATSGYVRVTLPRQELKSNIAFVVTQ